MADSILSPAGAASVNSGSIGAVRAGQELSKAMMSRLLSSIEQSGQASLPTPPNRVDRVQISQEAQQKLASEQCAG